MQPLEKKPNSVMDRELADIAHQLVDEFGIDTAPEGRSEELEIEIRKSLKSVAGIGQGYSISVRSGPLPQAEEEDGQLSSEEAKLAAFGAGVLERSRRFEFMNMSGLPILGNPADSADEPTEDGSDPTRPTTDFQAPKIMPVVGAV